MAVDNKLTWPLILSIKRVISSKVEKYWYLHALPLMNKASFEIFGTTLNDLHIEKIHQRIQSPIYVSLCTCEWMYWTRNSPLQNQTTPFFKIKDLKNLNIRIPNSRYWNKLLERQKLCSCTTWKTELLLFCASRILANGDVPSYNFTSYNKGFCTMVNVASPSILELETSSSLTDFRWFAPPTSAAGSEFTEMPSVFSPLYTSSLPMGLQNKGI